MKELEFKIIKNQKQYDGYCEKLEALVMNQETDYSDTIELLSLLIHDYNERMMKDKCQEMTPVELLQDLISENNLTQLELSRRLSVSPQLLNDVLKMRREITKSLAHKLSAEFCISYSAFLKAYDLKKAS